MTANNPRLNELIKDRELCNLILEPINPCIDINLPNLKTRLMKTLTFETGIPDHDKVIGIMPRSPFSKAKPNKMFYR